MHEPESVAAAADERVHRTNDPSASPRCGPPAVRTRERKRPGHCFGGASPAAAGDRAAARPRLSAFPSFVRSLAVVVFVIPVPWPRRPAGLVPRSVPGRTGPSVAVRRRASKWRESVGSRRLWSEAFQRYRGGELARLDNETRPGSRVRPGSPATQRRQTSPALLSTTLSRCPRPCADMHRNISQYAPPEGPRQCPSERRHKWHRWHTFGRCSAPPPATDVIAVETCARVESRPGVGIARPSAGPRRWGRSARPPPGWRCELQSSIRRRRPLQWAPPEVGQGVRHAAARAQDLPSNRPPDRHLCPGRRESASPGCRSEPFCGARPGSGATS